MHRNACALLFRHATTLAIGISILVSMSATFAASAAPPTRARHDASSTSQDLSLALERDLGMDVRQLPAYLATERLATARVPEARRRLGATFAGAWLERGADNGFRLVIGTTGGDAAARIRALGADARIVQRSLAHLEVAKAKLDWLGQRRRLHPDIHAWFVDVASNQVVIEAHPKARGAARDFVAATGIDGASFRVEDSDDAPQPAAAIVGGERYNIGGSGCSIGFPVTQGANTGFTTAGHCGGVGTVTTGTAGEAQGVFAGAIFPTQDMAWVQITQPSAWLLSNSVSNYAGSAITVIGSAQALVGAMICRSGWKTGFRCGTVRANNVSVNYTAGTVYGLSSTSACIGKGDSGGAFVTPGGHAQGVASGGKSISSQTGHNCNDSSPTSYHQPLNPILSQFGLTLFTGGPQTPPIITHFNCPRPGDTGDGMYVCAVQYTSPTPATVQWLYEAGGSYTAENYSEFYGECVEGQYLNITATVTNVNGSTATPMQTFLCKMGPLP